MSEWTHRTVTVTRREWVLELETGAQGVTVGAVHRAVDAASNAYRLDYSIPVEALLSDDVLRLSARDGEVVVWYETEDGED